MHIIEFKAKLSEAQIVQAEKCIRAFQFIRNRCIAVWYERGEERMGRFDFVNLSTQIRRDNTFLKILDARTANAAGERAYSAINQYFKAKKDGRTYIINKPTFKKNAVSFEIRDKGWKANGVNSIRFNYLKIGTVKLVGSIRLSEGEINECTRIRFIRRANGYYAQLVFKGSKSETVKPTYRVTTISPTGDGLYKHKSGPVKPSPDTSLRPLKLNRIKRQINRTQHRSRKNSKARNAEKRINLKVERQRRDYTRKAAREIFLEYDTVNVEDLNGTNRASIACRETWSMFRKYLQSYAERFDKELVFVDRTPGHGETQRSRRKQNSA